MSSTMGYALLSMFPTKTIHHCIPSYLNMACLTNTTAFPVTLMSLSHVIQIG